MWQKLLLCILVLSGKIIFADDSLESFEDEVSFEFDPSFEDDFDDLGTGSLSRALSEDISHRFSARDIYRYENSISLFGGNETIASKYYLSLTPQGHFNTSYVKGHLGVPLRFAVYDNGSESMRGRSRGFVPIGSFIKPRERDYQSFWDSQLIVRDLQVFSPEEPYYFSLSRTQNVTFGHGELLSMDPASLYDQDSMFFSGHAEIMNSLTRVFLGPMFKAHTVGVSTRFAPLTSLAVPPFVAGLNFEASYINDFMAPNNIVKEDDYFVLNDEKRFLKRTENTAQGLVLGVLGEYVPVSFIRLKPYASLGQLWLTGLNSYGAGFHLGHDFVVDFMPGTNKSLLVLKTEGRIFSQKYWPGYFGPTYLVDRLVQENEEGPKSKSLVLSQAGDGSRVGYLLDLSYAYDEMLNASVGYENAHTIATSASFAPMRRFHLRTGFFGFDRLRLDLGYQATAIREFDQLFDFDKSRGLLSLRGQVKLASIIYFDAWAKHSFGVNDMFALADKNYSNGEPMWLTDVAETRSLNFGLGLELSMTF
jgi:hypothetical protein